MNQLKAYCGKIESVEVVDVEHCIVSFSNGATHRMQHSPALKQGATVAIDYYGRVWSKA